MSIKHIFFVRHGESELNGEGRWQFPETPLTPRGLRQAEFIAERCMSLDIDIVLSSMMVRALDTAKVIAEKTHAPLVEYEHLHEVLRPTALRGESKTDPRSIEYQQQAEQNWKDPSWHYGGEENFHDVTERARIALTTIENRPEERIVVATHGYFLRTMLAEMIFGHGKYDYDMLAAIQGSIKTSNTGLTYCTVQKGKWVVMTWNDFAHLGDEKVI